MVRQSQSSPAASQAPRQQGNDNDDGNKIAGNIGQLGDGRFELSVLHQLDNLCRIAAHLGGPN